MCARQQGDMCDYKAKCDEEKGFYCHIEKADDHIGICRGKFTGLFSQIFMNFYNVSSTLYIRVTIKTTYLFLFVNF